VNRKSIKPKSSAAHRKPPLPLHHFGIIGPRSLNLLTALAFLFIFASAGIFIRFGARAASTQVVSPLGNYNYCMDDFHSGTGATGAPNKVDIWACNGSSAQEWSYNSNHTVTLFGQCLDVYQSGKTNGSKVDLFPCTGGTNQLWTKTASNQLVNTGSGLCLDDPVASTTNGTQLQIWACNNSTQQIWYWVALATPPPPPPPTPAPTPPPTPAPTPPPPTPGPTANPTPNPGGGGNPTPTPTTNPGGGGSGGGTGGSGGGGGTGGGAGGGVDFGGGGGVATTDAPVAGTSGPVTPTGFKATNTANAVVVLSWNASSAIQTYTLERSEDQNNWSLITSGITTNTFSDSSTDFGVHYYYRLSAVDTGGNQSGYATADVTTPAFTANATGDNGSTFTSDDNLASVSVPSGAISNAADCTVAPNTTKVTLKNNLKVVVGPYQLVCKDAAGNTITSFLRPLTWTLNVKGKLKGVGKPSAYSIDDNGNTTSIAGSSFSSANNQVKFSTTTSNSIAALAALKPGFPWNLLAIILLVLGIIAGVAVLIIRRNRAINYNDYLREKYYNL
jgi:uncharacterized membrane protein YgcG